jgi:rubrerythrin
MNQCPTALKIWLGDNFMDIRKIYEYALQREYEGKRFFEQNADRLNNAAAVSAFKNLALEEQKHIEFIQNQLDLLGRGESSSTEFGVALQKEGFFSQRANSENLEQTVNEAMVADLPVLRMAYLIEHDLADFYETASRKATDDARDVLKMLATWERGHERLFKNMHDKAFDEYAEMPWGG